MGERYRFTSPVWEWQSRDNWFFVTLPADYGAEVRELPLPPRGFGSVAVRVTIGGTSWSTSMFPNATTGEYSLPLKASVRKKEGIEKGDTVQVELALLE